VIYSPASDHLRNTTQLYQSVTAVRQTRRLPDRADAGNPLYSWLFGPEWTQPESNFRWMPSKASLRLGAPEGTSSHIELRGTCPEEQLSTGPRHLKVTVNRQLAGETDIYAPESSFQRLFPLPGVLETGQTAEVGIEVTPVTRKDGREYGLVFGTIALRP